ncbi:MAG: hypothetical protein K2M11_06650 [Paramuribaculum sp.]|nr:hypothetical protein [Paramuribaculum sp.]
MKRHAIIIITLLLSALGASAQRAIHIYHDGKDEADVMLNCQIDSIYFATEGKELRQVFATAKEKKSYPVTSIDSIKFQGEFLKILKPNITIPYEYSYVYGTALSSEDRDQYGNFKNGVFSIHEYISSNYTDKVIQHKIPVKSWSGTLCDTLYITQLQQEDGDPFVRYKGHARWSDDINITDGPLFSQTNPALIILSPDSQSINIPVNPLLEGTLKIDPTYSNAESFVPQWAPRLNDDSEEWFQVVRKDPNTITITVTENKGGYRHCFVQLSADTYSNTYPHRVIAQLPASTHSAEEHRKALEDMYYALNGPNWRNQNNWLSALPIYEWGYINSEDNSNSKCPPLLDSDRVLAVIFHTASNFDNGDNLTTLEGMLPESFTTIMDDAIYMDLRYMGIIKGKVPYAITHHPKWRKAGWTFIKQSPSTGADIDFEGINLQLPDSLVWDLVEGKRISTSDILKKNKLTLIMNVSGMKDEYLDDQSDELINKYLDYAPKGLGLVLAPGTFPERFNEATDLHEYQRMIANFRKLGIPEDIDWTYTFSNATGTTDSRYVGDMALFDTNGELLWFGSRALDATQKYFKFSFYTDRIDAVCRKHLGEPVEHPQFAMNRYTSTDFSQDGEVIQLQKATVGKGIDVVFLGNGYDDRDMESFYLDQMREAMEQLFADEVMQKLRDRFNVYTVKVVSLNPYSYITGEHRLKSFEDAWEYASRIPDIVREKSHICIINNTGFTAFISGSTGMYTEGGSEAWIEEGGPDHTIAHEVAGHGIGKLLDEYVYDDFKDNHTQEGAHDSFCEWIKTDYHDHGWGLNVSTSEKPEESPWAWMFEDPDFASKVGMYKGAWFWPEELWRPSESSMMHNDLKDLTFNAPSREAIYKQVMQASEGDDWVYDREAFKAFDKTPAPASRSAAAPAVKDSSKKIYIHKAPKIMKKDAKGRYISEPFDRSFIKSAPASRAAEADSTDADSMPFSIYETPDGKRHIVTTSRK